MGRRGESSQPQGPSPAPDRTRRIFPAGRKSREVRSVSTKSTKHKTPEAQPVAVPYELTPEEIRAVQSHRDRLTAKPPAPRMKVHPDDRRRLAPNHPDPDVGHLLLMQALGTASVDFSHGLLGQIANAASKGQTVDEPGLNFMLSVVTGIEPNDELEAMLGAQMAAVHLATMTFARRLNHVDNIVQQDSAERAFNKLARTFAVQMEALKRYRTGGEQKVTVQHVTVNEGGQAIVGNVARQGGGGDKKTGDQPHAQALAHAPGTPLWSQDQEQEPVSRARDAERTLPNARGSLARRAKGSGEREL